MISSKGVISTVQKHVTLNNETELRNLLDKFFLDTKRAIEDGNSPNFKNLLEIIQSDIVIVTAMHKLKANSGSLTSGTDNEDIRIHFLEKDYLSVIKRVKEAFNRYEPIPVKRVHIPKPGKKEMRPLGIPAMIDRIVQQCIKIVIEPILEAQFFEHSYGFRPMRQADMAMARVAHVAYHAKHHWVVEGDIKGFFDNVNHTILIKRLWGLGIRDKRVLMIIKQMLKAGIMNVTNRSEIGTPQGGILSPLLANAYLDAMDKWITREWENKKMNPEISVDKRKNRALERYSKLKPCYLIRYADDWVLMCKNKSDAEKFKYRIDKYLKNKLKLELSHEKTVITNIRKKPIKFLGFHFKVRRDKSKKDWKAIRYGWLPTSRPDPIRLKAKANELHKKVKNLRHFKLENKDGLIHEINRINSSIRGTINYYQASSRVNKDLAKYAPKIKYAAYKALKKFGGDWGPANETNNLISIHSKYKSYVAYIEHMNMKIGVTALDFCRFEENTLKTQAETPYSVEGRKLYEKRTGKVPTLARADDVLKLHTSKLIATGRTSKRYNFEYFMNKAYAFNRDKGKCRVCGLQAETDNVHFHHISPKLPIELLNRVNNLATVHIPCHKMIHSKEDYSNILTTQTYKRLIKFREKVNG